MTGSKTFDFRGAKFHGPRCTTAGHQNFWAEVLDFPGPKSDGSIIRKLNIPVSRTIWSVIFFPNVTGLVELPIMGRPPSHPGVAFANSMWLMDDFNYTPHLSECKVKFACSWGWIFAHQAFIYRYMIELKFKWKRPGRSEALKCIYF